MRQRVRGQIDEADVQTTLTRDAMIDAAATAGTQVPRVLLLCMAVTGGVAATIVAQVVLADVGLDLAAVSRDVTAIRTAQMRSAFAWWAIGGIAFLAGLVIAFLIPRAADLFGRFAALQWLGGAGLVVGLAVVAGKAAAPSGLPPAVSVAVGLSSLVLAGFASLLGAFFATRR